MGATAAMGWQGLGKPDFSKAAQLFYRLPAELREGLNRSEEKVLIWSVFFSWWTQAHAGRLNALASYSESHLGARFGRSRWTVIRALAKLEELGLVKRIRRAPAKDGSFRTNLVALSAKLTALFAMNRRQVLDLSPCSKNAPQQVRNLNKSERAASLSAPPPLASQEEGKCLEKAKQLFGKWSELPGPKPRIVFGA